MSVMDVVHLGLLLLAMARTKGVGGINRGVGSDWRAREDGVMLTGGAVHLIDVNRHGVANTESDVVGIALTCESPYRFYIQNDLFCLNMKPLVCGIFKAHDVN